MGVRGGLCMTSGESLESYRRAFHPDIPSSLSDFSLLASTHEVKARVDEEILSLLPHLDNEWILTFAPTAIPKERPPLRVGVLLSGGPAPGGHTVISGLFDAIHEWNPASTLIGFHGGPSGLLKNNARKLPAEEIEKVRNTGGFSLLGTGRTKIETKEEIDLAFQTVEEHKLDGLVFIGGDDSNTDAAFLAEAFRAKGSLISVVGVPKTIDGDLQAPKMPISFGFDTACKTYSVTIGNIAKDILSTKRNYFFIRLMGRTASHITLECALRTQPNLALISEEIASRKLTLHGLVREVADLVEERTKKGLNYGLVLVPEGIIEQLTDVQQLIAELNDLFAPQHSLASALKEFTTLKERLEFILDHLTEPSHQCLSEFPPEIREQLVHERDPHGNVQVSLIETARLLGLLVQEELSRRASHTGAKIPFSFQTAFCGYEGRSAFPSNFDCTYSYALGRCAALLIANKMTGYMAAISSLHCDVKEWRSHAIPLASLLHFERRGGSRKPVIRKTLVDLTGEVFRYFAGKREEWRLSDAYLQPGPIQFFGPHTLSNEPCLSLRLRSSTDASSR